MLVLNFGAALPVLHNVLDDTTSGAGLTHIDGSLVLHTIKYS